MKKNLLLMLAGAVLVYSAALLAWERRTDSDCERMVQLDNTWNLATFGIAPSLFGEDD